MLYWVVTTMLGHDPKVRRMGDMWRKRRSGKRRKGFAFV